MKIKGIKGKEKMKAINVFETILLVSVVLGLLVDVSGATWCDTDFVKRINVSVNNTGGSALTNYQVYINLSSNPINETSLRVYNSSDCSLRPHWTENETGGNSYGVWINYSSIAASAWTNKTAIYYDNSTASSASNGANTFEFFDDFDDGGAVVTFGIHESCQYTTESGDIFAGCRDCLNRMETFVNTMNSENPNFCIQLGDFANGYTNKTISLAHIDLVEAKYDDLTMDRYYVLGNHDEQFTSKSEFFAHTGASQKNFSFDVGDFHFIVLDANFRSDNDSDDYDSGNQDWTVAYVPPNQRTWLTNDLAGTSKKSMIFIHQILDPNGAASFKVANAAAVRTIIENSGKVIAVFQGHHEEDYLNYVNDIPYVQIYEMADVDGSGYAKVSIYSDNRIYINGYLLHGNYTTIGDKWTAVSKGSGGSINVDAGICKLQVTDAQVGSASIQSNDTWTNNVAIEVRRKSLDDWHVGFTFGSGSVCDVDGNSSSWHRTTMHSSYFLEMYSTDANLAMDIYMPSTGAKVYLGDDWTALSSDFTNYHTWKYIYTDSGLMSWHMDNILKTSFTNTSYLSDEKNILISQCSQDVSGRGDDTYVDWVFVRKYASPEPSSTLGSEEDAPATTPVISNVVNGSISPTSQWIDWDVNQTAHNRILYSNESDLTPAYYSSWENSTNAPNITLSGLYASTQYWYQVWSYNTTNTSLSDNSSTLSFTTTSMDTSFTVTLPSGHAYLKFEPTNSTVQNVTPNGQTDAQEFYNVTNTGNLNLDIRLKLNETVSNIVLKADTDNNPLGAKEVNTTLVTIYSNLAISNSADIWLWSDFSHAVEQDTNKTINVNVTQSA